MSAHYWDNHYCHNIVTETRRLSVPKKERVLLKVTRPTRGLLTKTFPTKNYDLKKIK